MNLTIKLLRQVYLSGSNAILNDRIHKGARFTVSRNNVDLGPGIYEIPSSVGKGPKCSIRPRTALPKRPEIPGPGKYDPTFNSVTRRVGTAIAGTTKRHTLAVKESGVPGPGAYHEESKKLKGSSFTFKKSKETQPKVSEPGPGSYEVPSSIANWPSYAMNKKNTQYRYI
jgi:hypothetical protein